jgi:acetoin utilization protein AcuB
MKISKYMTDKLVTAKPDDGVRETFFTMREKGIRHMPVVAEDGKLAGIISDRDLRRPDWVDEAVDVTHAYRLEDDIMVRDLMTTNVIAVHTYDTVHKAVGVFRERKYGALPVLNKGDELVGIITPLDCLGALDDALDPKKAPA